MHQFFKKISFFISAYFIFLFFVYVFNLIMLKSSDMPFSDVDILILGDSHNGCAINPSHFKSAYNLSLNDESYVPTYYKLKKLIDVCIVDTILLSLSPHNISSFYEAKYLEKNQSKIFFSKYYPLFNFNSLKNLNIDIFQFCINYFKWMVLKPRINHLDPMIGSFAFRKSKQNVSYNDNVNQRINMHFYDDDILHDVSETMIAYLDSIVNICEKNSIKLYLISTPLHSEYYQAIPDSFKSEFQSQIIRLNDIGQSVFDYTLMYNEDSLFLDGDHLNINGANYFTNVIKKRLKDD